MADDWVTSYVASYDFIKSSYTTIVYDDVMMSMIVIYI